MKTYSKNKYYIHFFSLLSVGVVFLLFPTLLFAATEKYVPLEAIPGFPGSSGGGLPQYLNSIYKLLIVVGAMIACVKIIMAGVKWSMSGIVTDKSDAKHDIQGALLGLAILLIPAIVLNTINPNLISLDILRSAGDVKFDMTVNPSTPAKKYADTDPNSTEAPPGMTFQNCNYTSVAITPQTDALGGLTGDAERVYDDTHCKALCSEKGGTFLTLGKESGRCTFKADTNNNVVNPDNAVQYVAP